MPPIPAETAHTSAGSVPRSPLTIRRRDDNQPAEVKLLRASLFALTVSAFLAGCATTDTELTQKEKDKIARDMERASQKQAQAQEKMMREATQGNQRKLGR